jgi:uncharacterized membrane protein
MLFSLPLLLRRASPPGCKGKSEKGETEMAFCPNCGTKLEDGKRFCTNCGTQIEAPAAPAAPSFDDGPVQAAPAPEYEAQAAPQQQPAPAPAPAEDLGSKVAQLNETPDTTSSFDTDDVNNNKGMSILAYLGILVLIPIFARKDSPFARYHSNQGLILLICWVIVAILRRIWWLLGTVGGLIGFILMIIGIVNAANGRAKELPLVGKFRLLK